MMDEGGKATALAMIETIDEKLLSATSLNKAGYYNDSLSRSCYAAFHSVSMLFFLPGRSFRSHGQLIGAFNKDFVATGLFDTMPGKALGRLYDGRQSADYDVFMETDREESELALADAERIAREIIEYANR